MKRVLSSPFLAGLALILLSAVALSSCGGDNTGNAPPRDDILLGDAASGGAPVPGESTPTPPAITTGNSAIVAVIDAVARRDADALRGKVAFTLLECTNYIGQGSGGPPACPPSVAHGTDIEVFPASACEGFYTHPDGVRALLARTLEQSPRLVAVYRVTAAGTPALPEGGFVLLFERTSGPSRGYATSLSLSADGRVVGQSEGCAMSPPQRLASVPADALLLGPLAH